MAFQGATLVSGLTGSRIRQPICLAYLSSDASHADKSLRCERFSGNIARRRASTNVGQLLCGAAWQPPGNGVMDALRDA